MTNSKYTVTCIYCEHFDYNPSSIETNPFKKEYCFVALKNCSPTDKICDSFKLRSGLYTTKTYPKKSGD